MAPARHQKVVRTTKMAIDGHTLAHDVKREVEEGKEGAREWVGNKDKGSVEVQARSSASDQARLRPSPRASLF